MEWILSHKAEIVIGILFFAGAIERFAHLTPPDYKLFSIPIGRYDNEVAKLVKFIVKAIWPTKTK